MLRFLGTSVQGVLVLFLSFSLQNNPAFAAAPEIKTYKNYSELVRAIRGVPHAPRSRPKGRIVESWTLGKLIENHVGEYRLWHEYSADVNKRLSKDLPMDWRALALVRQFARAYPDAPPSRNLEWTHYTEVLEVKDPVQREAILDKCEKEKCAAYTLGQELKKIPHKKPVKPLLPVLPQKFYLYPVAKAEHGEPQGRLVLKLGFSNEYKLPGIEAFKEGDILNCKPSAACVLDRGAEASDLFVYAAEVIQIIDGDTLDVDVDLNFGMATRQRLRLRGIDAAELNTRKGVAAKTFVFNEITKTHGHVILKVGPLDKYNRYLAHVWVDGK